MTSTLCQSAAKIAAFLHTIKTILAIAEIVRTVLHETMGRLRRRRGVQPALARAPHGAVGAAPARIADNRKVALDVCLPAGMCEARQAPSPQAVPDRSREESAAVMVPMARESPRISKSLRVTIRVAGGRHVRT